MYEKTLWQLIAEMWDMNHSPSERSLQEPLANGRKKILLVFLLLLLYFNERNLNNRKNRNRIQKCSVDECSNTNPWREANIGSVILMQ